MYRYKTHLELELDYVVARLDAVCILVLCEGYLSNQACVKHAAQARALGSCRGGRCYRYDFIHLT